MTHQGTKPLQTKRLLLRQFTPTDAQAMYDNWAKEEQVARYLTWPPHESLEVTKALLKDWCSSYAEPDYYNWVMEYEGIPIGNVSAVRVSEKNQWVELGYCMSPAHWNKGLMTEAVRAVIDFFFREVEVHRICISHATRNPASGKVAQKCGLSYEGTARESFRSRKGEYWDIANYGIIRSQWEAKK